jgi:hypothetical protein
MQRPARAVVRPGVPGRAHPVSVTSDPSSAGQPHAIRASRECSDVADV